MQYALTFLLTMSSSLSQPFAFAYDGLVPELCISGYGSLSKVVIEL
jgi:hypothetical protein